MAENIEIKARCADLREATRIARRLGARPLGIERQRDTYFGLPLSRAAAGARLKLRERWPAANQRATAASSSTSAQLIPYARPSIAGPKRSRYAVIPVEEPHMVRSLLSDMLGVVKVVDKRRTVFLLDNVRIHLDRVRGLGTFLEFEAVVGRGRGARARCRGKVKALLAEFAVRPSDLLTASYAEMAVPRACRPR